MDWNCLNYKQVVISFYTLGGAVAEKAIIGVSPNLSFKVFKSRKLLRKVYHNMQCASSIKNRFTLLFCASYSKRPP